MNRRTLLRLLAGSMAGASGCTAVPLGNDGPNPTVVDHVRGDVAVTETERVFSLGGDGQAIRATVENTRHDATVRLRLYWVPEVGLNPEGKSHERLQEMGYELEATQRFELAGGAETTRTFEISYPEDVAGYYLRKDNLTFGGIVENRGEAGPVTVELFDTSERGNPVHLQTKGIEMDAGERRTVLFESTEQFAVFRVEASAGRPN